MRITRYRTLKGRYISDKDGVHRIGVDGGLGLREANRTLWHELAHVLQAERLGGSDAFDREWRQQMKEGGVTRQWVGFRDLPLHAVEVRDAFQRRRLTSFLRGRNASCFACISCRTLKRLLATGSR